jgi:hypothetical protein
MNQKMIKKTILIIIAVIGFIILWNVTGFMVEKHYKKWIRSHKKGYCYQTYWGPVNQVLYVKNKYDMDALIQYYQKIEKGENNPTFNFPVNTLPFDTFVYILDYERDSMIAKIACYYKYGKYHDFIKGYVYSGTLHNFPPNDSLIKLKNK